MSSLKGLNHRYTVDLPNPAGGITTFEVMRTGDQVGLWLGHNKIAGIGVPEIATLLKSQPGSYVCRGNVAFQVDDSRETHVTLAWRLGKWSIFGPCVGVPE